MHSITSLAGEVGVAHGGADVGVAKPVFHSKEISSGVQHVNSNGVFEDVEVALVWRETGFFSITFHEVVKGGAVDGCALSGKEEGWDLVFSGFEIAFDQGQLVGLHQVLSGEGAFLSGDADAGAVKVYV